jgi:LL-diaminopimelate aminotransferase
MDELQTHYFAGLDQKIEALKRAGEDVVRLDVGSPDMPPAPHILQALQQSAADPGSHGYGSHRGTAALRRAWAETYRRLHAVALDPETEVLPLLGSKEGVFHLMQAVLAPGDVALLPDPGYPTYSSASRFAGAEVGLMRLDPRSGYVPDLSAVPGDVLRRAKLIWLNYPNNPTGATTEVEFLRHAVAFARENDLLLCHDAAYSQVTFDGYRAPSVLEVPGATEVAVEFNTLSKSHNMAGWRVGVAVGNREVLRRLLAVKSHADSGHFGPVVAGAIAALNGDQLWLVERNAEYERRRDRIVEALRALGLACENPRASLYVWCALPMGWRSIDFASALLEQARVSVTPGAVFGPGGEGFIRISLAAPEERVALAMDRLARWWREDRRAA